MNINIEDEICRYISMCRLAGVYYPFYTILDNEFNVLESGFANDDDDLDGLKVIAMDHLHELMNEYVDLCLVFSSRSDVIITDGDVCNMIITKYINNKGSTTILTELKNDCVVEMHMAHCHDIILDNYDGGSIACV